ncbi:MAG: hypothetical protein IPJ19_08510 [Planctomycetes bacterium]|nr:hypothetical protein [Planctomycetota bacterium]
MKKTLLLASLLLVLPALQAVRPPVAKVHFAPAEGTKLTRTLSNKSEFSLDDLTLKMNGQESPMKPEVEMTMTQSQKIVVQDEYVKMRDGAPKVLRRKYDELGSDMAVNAKIEMAGQSQDQNKSGKGKSELEGKTVVYTWDEDSKAYKTAFDPAEERSELLKGLQEDMDLRVLLPKEEVKEGDEWEIDVAKLASVIAPGGELKLKPEDSADAESPMGMGDMSGMSSLSDWLGDSLNGTAKGTFKGMREVGGHNYGVIAVELQLKGAKDLTDTVKGAMEKAAQEGMTMETKSVDVEFEISGQGELLWDLEAGHAHSFEFSGPSGARLDIQMGLEVQGRSMDIEQGLELSGTITLKYTIE